MRPANRAPHDQPFRAFDPLRFPAAEMRVLAIVFALIGCGWAAVLGSFDAGFAGWWVAVTAAFVVVGSYLERYLDWYVEGMASRAIWRNAVAGFAPILTVFAVALREEPVSAALGILLVCPFFFIAEHWRRSHAP